MNPSMSMTGALSLAAAFLAGLAGSVHCMAMCGGLSGALTLRTRHAGVSSRGAFAHSLVRQLGRLASYSIAGAVSAGVIGSIATFIAFQPLGLALRSMTGLVLVAAAVGMLFTWRPLARVEALGGRLWRQLSPLTRGISADRLSGSLLLGMLWGWLPCGMVYSMLLLAALSGSAAKGAATMLSFGLGTTPALILACLASTQILRPRAGRGLNLAFGMLLLALGILSVVAPWVLPTHVHYV